MRKREEGGRKKRRASINRFGPCRWVIAFEASSCSTTLSRAQLHALQRARTDSASLSAMGAAAAMVASFYGEEEEERKEERRRRRRRRSTLAKGRRRRGALSFSLSRASEDSLCAKLLLSLSHTRACLFSPSPRGEREREKGREKGERRRKEKGNRL